MGVWDALRGSGVTIPLFRDISVSAVFFLFHTQLMLCLLENVYLLDYLQLRLDEKVLALLSIFTPILFLAFYFISGVYHLYVTSRVRLVAGLLTLFLRALAFFFTAPELKLILSSLGIGCFWIYFPATLATISKKSVKRASLMIGVGLALATLLSVMFRTLYNTRDLSALPGWYNVIGLVLAIIAGIGLAYSSLKAPSETTMKDFDDLLLSPDAKKKRERHPCIDFLRVFGLTTTLVLIMMTLYVVFDSPAVLARWTAGNYLFVILFASLVIDIFLTILVILPKAILRLNRAVLFMWNLVFALMLLFTIVSQRIAFPPTPTSPALEVRPNVRAPQYLVLALNILLHPILFVDAIIASKQLVKLRPTNAVLGISFVLSNGIAAAVLVMHLFTNVWGYLEPVSHYFRNGFYIPFVFIGFFLISVVGVVDGKWLVKCCKRKNKKKAEGDFGQITEAEEDGVGDLMAGFTTDFQTDLEADFEVTMERSYDEFPNNGPRLLSPPNDRHRAHHSRNQWSKKAKALIILLFFGMTVASIVGCLMTESRPQIPPKPMNITILQYNIRQGVSTTGRVVDQQLDLIRQINPDIIGLEECDSTRVFLNNFDIVRFFANKLQYYSFYGPKTTSGTFGVCILSRFPLYDPFVIYTYSDKDEVATSSVTIDIPEYGNLTLYVSHPDGSSQAMMSQTSELLSRVSNLTNSQKVLSIGDFNYNTSSVYYKLTRNHLLDPWYVLYPSGVNENGQNKSADFDHIFLDFSWRNKVRNVTYIYPPASFSDHPVHYVTLEL